MSDYSYWLQKDAKLWASKREPTNIWPCEDAIDARAQAKSKLLSEGKIWASANLPDFLPPEIFEGAAAKWSHQSVSIADDEWV